MKKKKLMPATLFVQEDPPELVEGEGTRRLALFEEELASVVGGNEYVLIGGGFGYATTKHCHTKSQMGLYIRLDDDCH